MFHFYHGKSDQSKNTCSESLGTEETCADGRVGPSDASACSILSFLAYAESNLNDKGK